MGYFSEMTPGSNSARRQVLRGVLFGFLAFVVFSATYVSWHSLFRFDPVAAVIWAIAGMAGLWGISRLVIAERARAARQADDGFGITSSER